MPHAKTSHALLLALLLASCDSGKGDAPAPSAAPEHAVSSAAASASVAATPAPSATASAGAETGAVAEPAVALSAAAGGSASAASAAPAAQKRGEIAIPSTTSGILAAGAADKILKSGQKPIVRLLDPGAEPKSALAYSFSKGEKLLAVSLDMLMALKGAGKTMPPTAVPRMTMTLELNPAEKNAEEDWKVDAKLRGVTVDPKGDQEKQIADAMRGQLDGMKGLTMSYWVSPHGSVHDVKVDTPAGFPAQAQQMLQGMNQSFESMVAPLPSDPVGVGARWQVVTRLASSGADLLQFATFTLKSHEGTKIGVDVTLKQLAANEQIKAPGMPAGMSAKVKSFSSSGTGSNQIDTKDIAPTSGKLTVKSAMELGVGQGASPAESMAIESTMTVSFSRPEQ